jgi:hypothetical protein
VEAKKFSCLSGGTLERCELFASKDSNPGPQLENSLSSAANFRARAKAKQSEAFSQSTGKIGMLQPPLREELWSFLVKQGGAWEEKTVLTCLPKVL